MSIHSYLCRAFTFLALVSSILIALPADGQTSTVPQITISAFDGFEAVTEHKLGNHLYVTVDHGSPDTDYTAKLVDETGFVVATQDLKTDDQGWAEPELLWHRSGIIGCRDDMTPNPYVYRFTDYEGAETLGGRTFTMQLFNSAGRIQHQASIPLVVDLTPRFYFSDATGCPMKVNQLSATDTVWLTGIHLDPTTTTDLSVWLVRNPSVWYDDSVILTDARPAYQNSGQLLTFSGTSTKETVPLLGFNDDGDCIWGTLQPPVDGDEEEPGDGTGEGGEDPGGSGGSGTESSPAPLLIGPNFSLDPFMENSSASGPAEVDAQATDPDEPLVGPGSTSYGSCPPCEDCQKPPWYQL